MFDNLINILNITAYGNNYIINFDNYIFVIIDGNNKNKKSIRK